MSDKELNLKYNKYLKKINMMSGGGKFADTKANISTITTSDLIDLDNDDIEYFKTQINKNIDDNTKTATIKTSFSAGYKYISSYNISKEINNLTKIIDALGTNNTTLKAENTGLKTDNADLKAKLTSNPTCYSDITLKKENKSLSDENTSLKQKLNEYEQIISSNDDTKNKLQQCLNQQMVTENLFALQFDYPPPLMTKNNSKRHSRKRYKE